MFRITSAASGITAAELSVTLPEIVAVLPAHPGRCALNRAGHQPHQTKNQDWGVSFFHLLDPPVGRRRIGPGRLQLKHLLRCKANRDTPRYRFTQCMQKRSRRGRAELLELRSILLLTLTARRNIIHPNYKTHAFCRGICMHRSSGESQAWDS